MRRGASLSALLFAGAAFLTLAVSPALGDSWDEVLAKRLADSVQVRQARLLLRQAELRGDQATKPYLPSLVFGTSGQAGIGVQNGIFTGGALRTDLTMTGILGADLSLQAPLSIAKDGKAEAGNPSLNLSRKIFVESAADSLSAQGALLKAQVSLQDAEDAVRIQLVTDTLNAVYYARLLDANRQNLQVLERVREATPEVSRREVERRILQAQRAILSASSAISALDAGIQNQADQLYRAIQARSDAWVSSVPGMDAAIPVPASIKAQELELAALEKKKAFSILPYLPNPSVSGQIVYDLKKETFNWNLGLIFSITLLDKGERALSALQRRENAEIEALRLEASKKSLADTIRQARDRLALLDLDRRLKALDVEDKLEAEAKLKSLFEGGFTTEENLIIGNTDVTVVRLEAIKIDHDILIQKLRLAQYFSAE